MSSYRSRAIHPETGEVREADFLEHQFGPRRYGVRFVGEERVWPIENVKPAPKEESSDAE